MKPFYLLLCLFLVFITIPIELFAQIGKQSPAKAGYAYPAGGQCGTTFEVWVVGRNLIRTVDASFSGTGISAKIKDTMYAFRNLDQRDRYMIRNRIGDCAERLVSETPEGVFMKNLITKIPKVSKPPDPPEEIEAVPFIWPRHVMLRKIAEPDAYVPFDEMLEIVYFMYGPGQWRRAPDILSDIVILEVTIAPDAEPGDRELRLVTMSGLSTPLYFQVGIHPEVREREPNSPDTNGLAAFMLEFPEPIYDMPVVFNGQILQSDIDRFKFRAKKGEQLVLHAQARQLMPYLADAVPGWFEAVVTVYDVNGKELAYSDCHRFEADPLLVFIPPDDGVYTAEIRDSVFRGREDFVYRLSIAPSPVVESVYPLGLKEGTSAVLKLEGKNLAATEVQVEGVPGSNNFRTISKIGSQWLPIPIRYEVDLLNETFEAGNNNSSVSSQPIAKPIIVNGKISKPGEYDYYRFEGQEGEMVTIEVTARRLNSPLDSRIALFDAAGKLIAENDDGEAVNEKYMSPIFGLQTHNADSKLLLTLPAGGPFVLRIGDANRQGGNAYVYRLRLSKPRAEFDVYTTPSSFTYFAGNAEMIWFYVDRKENYDGSIEIRLVGDTQGFQLDGGLIQAGEKSIIATLTTPKEPRNKAVKLQFEAAATDAGQNIHRPVYAVDDMEQAFLYHHRVPASHYWVLMQNQRNGTGFRPINPEILKPLNLKQGQSVDVEFETAVSVPPTIFFYLRDSAPGLWVKKKSQEDKKLVLTFGANADTLQKTAEKEYAAGNPPIPEGQPQPVIEPKKSLAGNLLIVTDGESVGEKKTRYPMGLLPAIPFRLEP